MFKKLFPVIVTLVTAISCPAEENYTGFMDREQERLSEYSDRENQTISQISRDDNAGIAAAENEYLLWRKTEQQQFNDFRDRILKEWGDFAESSRTTWVEYGKDENSLGIVDFENGIVTVKIRVLHGERETDLRSRMVDAVKHLLGSRGSSSVLPVDDGSAPVLDRPLLDKQVVDSNHVVLDSANCSRFVSSLADQALSGVHPTLQIRFPLAPDNMRRRAEPYMAAIERCCSVYRLEISQVMATIHAESCFNPMALSSAHAIGLMQVVPETAGREAYQFVFDSDQIPTPRYLFTPQNNIELGCAYIYLLNNRHFGGVVDHDRRLYCSIAGYNGGPGMVANAFSRSGKLTNAITLINEMSTAREVYAFMLVHLEAAQTRDYLRTVVSLIPLYSTKGAGP